MCVRVHVRGMCVCVGVCVCVCACVPVHVFVCMCVFVTEGWIESWLDAAFLGAGLAAVFHPYKDSCQH